jgi:hypothetical protein
MKRTNQTGRLAVSGVLIAAAFIVRFWLFRRPDLDVHIHDTYWVIPVRHVSFWFVVGSACVLLLLAIRASRRREF